MLNAPLKIDDEFKAVCPPLTNDERRELAASIKRDGCREAIRTWRGYIIDGHNRYELCEELHCSYVSEEVPGLNNRAEVIAWIIRNQFARRNLTPMQRAELALRLKETVAAEAKKRQGARTDLKPKKDMVQKSAQSENGKTRDELAKMAGVSHDTIAKVEKIVTQAAPAVVEAARKGELSINAAYRTVAPKAEPKPAPMPQEARKPPAEPPAPITGNHAPKADAAPAEPSAPIAPYEPPPEPAEIKVRCNTKLFNRFSKVEIKRKLIRLATKLKEKQDEEPARDGRELCAELLSYLSGLFYITVKGNK